MNEVISQIVDLYEVNDPDGLKDALNQRENDLCDALREVARAQGLAPSITQLEIIQLAMGDQPDEATIELVRRQAEVELAQIDQLRQRFLGQ